jgi:hypothetical protein
LAHARTRQCFDGPRTHTTDAHHADVRATQAFLAGGTVKS